MQPLFLVLIGLTTGALSGLLGIGGGLVLVPLLVYGIGLGQLEAQGLSLAVITLPVMLPAAWQYYKQGHLALTMMAWVGVGFLAGSFLGGWELKFIPAEMLRKGFGALLVLVGLKMLF